MTRVMWWLAALAVTLTTATCAVKTEKHEALRASSDVPTAEDFPAPLTINGVKGCAKVTKFDGIETCPPIEGLTYLCARKSDDLPTAPPGATTCGTVTIVGGQCRPDKQLVRYQCAAVVGMPTPTPTPDQNPLAACQEKRPGFCWTRGAFADGQCFASCECGPRLANTVCVGPVWGAPTPRPTQKPTPRPSVVPTASPSPVPDPLALCRAGNPGWCWTSGQFAGNDCFSNCECSKRTTNTVCVGPGATTPAPTASPRPTASPSPAPTATPPLVCPAGQHAAWSCVVDATPRPTVKPTSTPAPTASPRPTSTKFTPTPKPTSISPSAAPTKAATQALAGVWFIPECTRVSQDLTRSRWYDWPYVYAAWPPGWNKFVTDNGAPCVGTQEIWNAGILVPNHWEHPDQANIDAAKPTVDVVTAALRVRRKQIDDMRAAGVPEDRLPKMPVLWCAETAASMYGFYVDSGAGGFYTTVNGKRTLKSAKDLPSVLPKYVEWMIEQYKAAGATEFADAPYVFLWAASMFADADAAKAGVKQAASAPRTDYRGRQFQPARGHLPTFAGTGSAALRAELTKNSPTLWPAGYEWKINPDRMTNGPAGSDIMDAPDAQAAKRDSSYYLLYLYALKGQHPEFTHAITQISNCGYNKPDDSPWWGVSKLVQQYNQLFGFPPEIQIEGCQAKTNVDAGRPWGAPYAQCRAYQSAAAFSGGKISMWLPNVYDAAGLDAAFKQCPAALRGPIQGEASSIMDTIQELMPLP